MTGVGPEEDAQVAAWPTARGVGRPINLGSGFQEWGLGRLSQVGMGARETAQAREPYPAADLQVGWAFQDGNLALWLPCSALFDGSPLLILLRLQNMASRACTVWPHPPFQSPLPWWWQAFRNPLGYKVTKYVKTRMFIAVSIFIMPSTKRSGEDNGILHFS